MSVAVVIAWAAALVLLGVFLSVHRYRRVRRRFTARQKSAARPATRTVLPDASKVLVYIDNDGSARELTVAEKAYVDTAFSPLDGARPYVKSHYPQRNGWGELRGFLHRKDVPDGVAIAPAPAESQSQQTPQAAAASILGLVRQHRPDDEDKLRFELPRN